GGEDTGTSHDSLASFVRARVKPVASTSGRPTLEPGDTHRQFGARSRGTRFGGRNQGGKGRARAFGRRSAGHTDCNQTSAAKGRAGSAQVHSRLSGSPGSRRRRATLVSREPAVDSNGKELVGQRTTSGCRTENVPAHC